uniref:DNA replication helicase dna2, putative n=1 Tax=Arundo donax TaxID=35708 RepID=A0A0A9DUM1_ARUDO
MTALSGFMISFNFKCDRSLPENLSLALAISNEPQHNLLP